MKERLRFGDSNTWGIFRKAVDIREGKGGNRVLAEAIKNKIVRM